MNGDEERDLIEFGGSAQPGPQPRARHWALVALAIVVIAGGVYLSNRASTHRAALKTSTAASTDAQSPILYAAGARGYGYVSGPPTAMFWLEFDVVPPSETFSKVTASVEPIYGLTDVRVYFLPPDVAKQAEGSDLGGLQSLQTLPVGVGFTVIIAGTPVCGPLPDRQPIDIHVRYTIDGKSGELVMIGTPLFESSDFYAMVGGPCVDSSAAPSPAP
ncbi:MAG TPA: hypothetical protein VKB59_09310 [Micromonosporaceae bacterium]|nr:hypothetical protein [Micromonosporaceae bacterium]